MTTVAIAGSRHLAPGMAPRLLIRFLANLSQNHPDSTILLRRGRKRPIAAFEQQVWALCDLVGLEVRWCVPPVDEELRFDNLDGTETIERRPLEGRAQTFTRDMEMVAMADLVLCFWDANEPASIGDGGTENLAGKAVDHNKVVYAYAVDGKVVQRVGEHDPKGLWADEVPSPA